MTTRATIGNNFKTLAPAYENPAAIQDALKVYHFGVTDPDGVAFAADSIEGHFTQAHDELDILEQRPIMMAKVGTEPSTIPNPAYTATPKIGDAIPDGQIWVDPNGSVSGFSGIDTNGNADLITSGTLNDARLPPTAQAATLSATYALVVDEIVLSASPVVGSSGTVTNSGGVPVNTFADAANSFASWTVAIPANWTTFDIEIEHFGSVNGNVVVRADRGWLGVGDAIAVTNGGNVTVTSVTTLAVSMIGTGIAVVANKLLSVRIIRLGSDAADTLTGVFNVRALRLIQAS